MVAQPARTEAFEALSHQYRRRLLLALLESTPRDVAAPDPPTAAEGPAVPTPAVTAIERYHVHHPKLAAKGYIDWDQASGEVSKGSNWDAIAPVLELLREHRDELPADWR